MIKIENNQAFTTDSDKKIFRVSQPTTYFSRCTLLLNETEKDFGEILTSEIPVEPVGPTPAELREHYYEENADKYLHKYYAYLAEGNTEKAEYYLSLYKAEKTKARELYPDEETIN